MESAKIIDRQTPAPLLARVGLARVGHETVKARAQVGPEPRAPRVEVREERLLERAQEERLRRIGRILRRGMPFQAQVLEDRLPVRGHQRVEGGPANVGLVTADWATIECRVAGKRIMNVPS